MPGVQGKIVGVFPPKEGTGAKGKWKVQNITIEDSTGKVRCSMWGMMTFEEDSKGREICFQSIGSNGKLKGVSVKMNVYVDKHGVQQQSIQVEVAKPENVRWADEAVQEDAAEPREAPKAQTTTYRDPVLPKPSQKSPEARIAQFAKLYTLCFNQALKIDIGVAPKEVIKDIASCLFIQSVREGLADKMDAVVEKEDDIPY